MFNFFLIFLKFMYKLFLCAYTMRADFGEKVSLKCSKEWEKYSVHALKYFFSNQKPFLAISSLNYWTIVPTSVGNSNFCKKCWENSPQVPKDLRHLFLTLLNVNAWGEFTVPTVLGGYCICQRKCILLNF